MKHLTSKSIWMIWMMTYSNSILLLLLVDVLVVFTWTSVSFPIHHHHHSNNKAHGVRHDRYGIPLRSSPTTATTTSDVPRTRSRSRSGVSPTVITTKLAEVVVLVQQQQQHPHDDHLCSVTGTTIQIHPQTWANITRLVSLRAQARHVQNYTLADVYKLQIDTVPIQFCRHNHDEIIIFPSMNEECWYDDGNHHDASNSRFTATTAPATTNINQYPVITTVSNENDPNNPSHPNSTGSSPITFRVAMTDISRKQGGGSTWSLICTIPIVVRANHPDRDTEWNDSTGRNTVLADAHRALGIAVTKADRTIPQSAQQNIDTDLHSTIQSAKIQLQDWYTIHEQLHNRTMNCNDMDATSTLTRDGTNEASGSQLLASSASTTTTTATAAISLDQLWELIRTTNNSNNNSNALLHWYMVETRLSGRTAADAAFWFAMSGIVDTALYELLVQVLTKELLRFGIRSSCRYKDIIDIVTRCAAAGIRDVPQLEDIVQQCLQNKALSKKDIPIPSPYFNLHSNECSILIWHFSTRQRKQRTFLQTASKHYFSEVVTQNANHDTEEHQSIAAAKDRDKETHPTFGINCTSDGRSADSVHEHDDDNSRSNTIFQWHEMFSDPTRPLIIDVGCGMGISLLGLASLPPPSDKNMTDSRSINDESAHNQFPYHLCNYIGVDLSSLSINYANGIAQRWNIHDRIVFVVDEAEHFLDQVLFSNYPGPIQRIFIQFPTPYRLSALLNDTNSDSDTHMDDSMDDEDDDDDDSENVGFVTNVDTIIHPTTETQRRGGNMQLPASIRNGGFMVTSELLNKVSQLLSTAQQSRVDTDSTTTTMPYHPDFLFQSNCEDVAVFVRNMARNEAGFIVNTEMSEAPVDDNEVDMTMLKSDLLKPTQRTLNWIASYDNANNNNTMDRFTDLERASGYGWWTKPILPNNGCTETEVACIMKQIPVHRFLLKPKS